MEISTDLRARFAAEIPEWTAKYPMPGPPKLFLLSDPEIPCKWVVLHGWLLTEAYKHECFPSLRNMNLDDCLMGDVLYRGSIEEEIEPQFMHERDNVYILKMGDRTYQEL